MLQISCIVPAMNEAARIVPVLRVAAAHPWIDEVIVVDDGSTDGTATVAARVPGVQVIRRAVNGGKTAALLDGIAAASGSHLLFLDADLAGLAQGDLSDLIAPVRAGQAAASLSLRGNAPRIWRAIGLDYISGERVVARASLPSDLSGFADLPGFGFEVALNRIWIAAGDGIAVVRWPCVASPAKTRKAGLRAGLVGDLRMLSHILRTVGVLGALRQIAALRRLARSCAKTSSNRNTTVTGHV